jgi:hypothetical protein
MYSVIERRLIRLVEEALLNAEKEQSKLSAGDLATMGLSGTMFRHFLNNIGSCCADIECDIRYLEVGIFGGSTLFSLLSGNAVTALAIDAWDTELFFLDAVEIEQAKTFVFDNMEAYSARSDLHIVQENSWNAPHSIFLDRTGLLANVYFYDAGHTLQDHFLALIHFFPSLDNTFIFIVDDWGLQNVRVGTIAAIAAMPVEIIARHEVLSPGVGMDKAEWNNGVGIFVLTKRLVR